MDYKYVPPPALAARRSTLSGGETVQKRFEQTLAYGAGTADGGRDLGKRFEGVRLYDEKPLARPRATSEYGSKGRQLKVNLNSYAPSPPESPAIVDSVPLPPYSESVDPSQQTYKVHLTDYRPLPAFTGKPEKPVHPDSEFAPALPEKLGEATPTAPPTEVATVKTSYSLGSAPPPSMELPGKAPPTHHTPSSYPPPHPASVANPNPVSYQPSPAKFQYYPPQQYAPPTDTPTSVAPPAPNGSKSKRVDNIVIVIFT